MPEKLTKGKKLKRARKHGFLTRANNRTGKQVIKRRRARGRKKV